MLKETVVGFQVCCCASQRLHEARRCVHSCVQAAAAARVAGGPDVLESAQGGDWDLVFFNLIADADGVNKRGE